jgi:plasmid stability protein
MLPVRNIPDEVGERLEGLAGREGMSVSAYVGCELTQLVRTADNADLLGALPDVGIAVDGVLHDLGGRRRDVNPHDDGGL